MWFPITRNLSDPELGDHANSNNRWDSTEFCRRNHIRRLALFGSVLSSDFRPDSDVDVLVEFEPEHVPGLFGIARMERELSAVFGGRKVDLRTAEDLSRYFRQEVLEKAEVQYDAEGRRLETVGPADRGERRIAGSV